MATESTNVKFSCPHCGQHLAVESDKAGLEFDCPSCGKKVIVNTSNAKENGVAIDINSNINTLKSEEVAQDSATSSDNNTVSNDNPFLKDWENAKAKAKAGGEVAKEYGKKAARTLVEAGDALKAKWEEESVKNRKDNPTRKEWIIVKLKVLFETLKWCWFNLLAKSSILKRTHTYVCYKWNSSSNRTRKFIKIGLVTALVIFVLVPIIDNVSGYKAKRQERRERIARAERWAAEKSRMQSRGLVYIGGKWMTPGSARNVEFEVFQIFEDGHALCQSSNGITFALLFSASDNRRIAEGDRFMNDLYRCGTYSYTTVQEARRRVPQYAIDLEVAEKLIDYEDSDGR